MIHSDGATQCYTSCSLQFHVLHRHRNLKICMHFFRHPAEGSQHPSHNVTRQEWANHWRPQADPHASWTGAPKPELHLDLAGELVMPQKVLSWSKLLVYAVGSYSGYFWCLRLSRKWISVAWEGRVYYLRLWETLGLKGANLIQLLLQSFLVPTAGEPLHLSFFG